MAHANRAPNVGVSGRLGITLVELLIALFVFSIVAVLAGSGIVQALRVQALNEASTSLQGKLRRITEVVSQDLRSTVLGAVIEPPSSLVGNEVVFMLAVGGQGFETEWSGSSATSLTVYADGQPVVPGDRILVVNGNGLGATMPVGGVSGGSGVYTVSLGGGCTTMIGSGRPVRLFVVDAVGYQLLANGDLQRQSAGQTAQALAFDLSEFEVRYAYRRQSDGTIDVRASPRTNAAGTPLRVAGQWVLESLRLRVAAEETIFGNRTVERSYSAQIALPPPGSVNLRRVVSCP